MPDALPFHDVAAALHALAALLDEDAPLDPLVRMGVAVLLGDLARRLDGHAGALADALMPRAA
jgi:hypothetical protein